MGGFQSKKSYEVEKESKKVGVEQRQKTIGRKNDRITLQLKEEVRETINASNLKNCNSIATEATAKTSKSNLNRTASLNKPESQSTGECIRIPLKAPSMEKSGEEVQKMINKIEKSIENESNLEGDNKTESLLDVEEDSKVITKINRNLVVDNSTTDKKDITENSIDKSNDIANIATGNDINSNERVTLEEDNGKHINTEKVNSYATEDTLSNTSINETNVNSKIIADNESVEEIEKGKSVNILDSQDNSGVPKITPHVQNSFEKCNENEFVYPNGKDIKQTEPPERNSCTDTEKPSLENNSNLSCTFESAKHLIPTDKIEQTTDSSQALSQDKLKTGEDSLESLQNKIQPSDVNSNQENNVQFKEEDTSLNYHSTLMEDGSTLVIRGGTPSEATNLEPAANEYENNESEFKKTIGKPSSNYKILNEIDNISAFEKTIRKSSLNDKTLDEVHNQSEFEKTIRKSSLYEETLDEVHNKSDFEKTIRKPSVNDETLEKIYNKLDDESISVLQKIEEIETNTKLLREKIIYFGGSSKSGEYRILNQALVRNMIKLDDLQVKNDDEKTERKRVIKFVQECLNALEKNVINKNGSDSE